MKLHLFAFHHAIQIYFLTPSPSQSDDRKPLAAEDVLFQVDQVAINLLVIEARRRSLKAWYCLINKLPLSCGPHCILPAKFEKEGLLGSLVESDTTL
jgi:hypothetical protein